MLSHAEDRLEMPMTPCSMALLKRIFTVEAFTESLMYVELLQPTKEHKSVEQCTTQACSIHQLLNNLFMLKVNTDMCNV